MWLVGHVMSELGEKVTHLLASVGERPSAATELLPMVYDEMRALAGSFFRQQSADHTLQPTALVHEAYLRLVGRGDVEWRSRAHFLAVAAKAMRQILVNHAVSKKADKRGGDWNRVTLCESDPAANESTVDLEALNEALKRLEDLDDRQVRIVEMRYFAGLSMEEIAHVLGLSLSAVEKDWRMARNWLKRELTT